MTATLIVTLIVLYFLMLVGISWLTSRKGSGNASFFSADRSAPWPVVAYGMVGTSLSGVTFLSVPGWVATSQFTYMQMVLGYLIGYAAIAFILLPVYYRRNVTSIYEYLGFRFGPITHRTGAVFFLLSRAVGAAFRLYLVALVFQILLAKCGMSGVPFWVPVIITIALIFIYTFRGGIKTVIWTDLVQTSFMLVAGIFAFFAIASALDQSPVALVTTISNQDFSTWWEWDWTQGNHFLKQLLSGAFIALAMTGLDQDMMQKNLTCPNLKSSQKNIGLFCIIMVVVNLGFLSLGGALYTYGESQGVLQIHPAEDLPVSIKDTETGEFIPRKTDEVFALLALDFLPVFVGGVFILGLIAAAYSSADSALTGLTTSFCVDFLGMDKSSSVPDRRRFWVQCAFAILLFVLILVFRKISEPAVITSIFKMAGYTYGPLLGFFAFGLIMPHKNWRPDKPAPIAAILAITATWWISSQFGNFIGFLILPINGFLTLTLMIIFCIIECRFFPGSQARGGDT